MSKRTQIVCMHEGRQGRSVDPVFINAFLKKYAPAWLRPWRTSMVRLVPCGGKTELRNQFPKELKNVLSARSDTTLIIFADMDDDIKKGDELKELYWKIAEENRISKDDFEKVVFIFSKDRIENWIQFIRTGITDENQEGPRVESNAIVRDAAQKLAEMCLKGEYKTNIPTSLAWSCSNWHSLVDRMKNNP